MSHEKLVELLYLDSGSSNPSNQWPTVRILKSGFISLQRTLSHEFHCVAFIAQKNVVENSRAFYCLKLN